MALRVLPENLSLIGPDINFLKSNKVLEKITECTVFLRWTTTCTTRCVPWCTFGVPGPRVATWSFGDLTGATSAVITSEFTVCTRNDNNYVEGKTAQKRAWSVRKEGEKKWQELEESYEFEMVSQSSFKAMDWFHCLKLSRQRIP